MANKINLPSWHVQCLTIVIFAVLVVVETIIDVELVSSNTVTAAVVASG